MKRSKAITIRLSPDELKQLDEARGEQSRADFITGKATAKRYNGWTNRETWLVNLWLTNEYSDYMAMREAARRMSQESFTDWLSTYIHEAITENVTPTGLAYDLLTDQLSEVNIKEIAGNFWSEEQH